MIGTHHEDLHVERLQALLTSARFGRSIEIRERTESTNDDARAAAKAGCADGHVVVADAQTRGRGSRGRSWDSPPGSDLYLSIVAKIDLPLAALAPLTLAVGLGVAESVELLLAQAGAQGEPGRAVRAEIKWPNDVWVQRRKVAGILVEGASLGQTNLPLVIGIGLNVNREQFPPGLDTPATSLRLERGSEIPRDQALAVLLARVEAAVDRFVERGAAEIARDVDQRLCLRGESAQCDGAVGIVRGVAASGALRLEVDGALRELFSGTLRPVA